MNKVLSSIVALSLVGGVAHAGDKKAKKAETPEHACRKHKKDKAKFEACVAEHAAKAAPAAEPAAAAAPAEAAPATK